MESTVNTRWTLAILAVACLVDSTLAAATGFDSAVAISATQFQNINSSLGYKFFIGQYFNGAAVSDANSVSGISVGYNADAVTSIKNARIADWNTLVDALHVPKYTTSMIIRYNLFIRNTTVYAQARYPIDRLNAAGGLIGRTWVAISQTAGSGWTNDVLANQAFLREFLSLFPRPMGPAVGILTNQADFQAIFGSTYIPVDGNGARVQLWWQNCNGVPQYTGFAAFNGWTSPVMHQYQCSVSNIGGQSGVNGNIDWIA